MKEKPEYDKEKIKPHFNEIIICPIAASYFYFGFIFASREL